MEGIEVSVPARNCTPARLAAAMCSSILANSRLRNSLYAGVRYLVSMPFSGFQNSRLDAGMYLARGSASSLRSSTKVRARSVTSVGGEIRAVLHQRAIEL